VTLGDAVSADEIDSRWGQDSASRETINPYIRPHPELGWNQKQEIGLDKDMHEDRVLGPVGRALLCYALRWLGAGTDSTERAPQDYQIALLKRPIIRELGA
jgi:hypothetical protein